MSLRWQVLFWVAAAVVFVIVLWLLREILLPFVAGMALAYLLDPLVKRLERIGLNRLVATLLVIGLFVIAFLLLIILIVPILGAQLAAFIERLPNTIARLQALVADPSRSWLRKVVGEGFRDADIGELVRQGSGYLATFLRSLWSGGQALVSIFSLVVITPVVAFYVLLRLGSHDGDDRQLGAIAASRDRASARPRDRPCDCRLRARAERGVPHPRLVLCARPVADRLEFRPADRPRVRAHQLHALCRLVDRPGAVAGRCDRPVLAGLDADHRRRSASSSSASSSRATCFRPSWSARASGCIRSG